MNKNSTDLTTKIEDLKQCAIKTGNTFVVDMINSNKNPNNLFYENMNKMMNKGSYHGNPERSNENLLDKVKGTLKLDEAKTYDIFNDYKNASDFFSHKNNDVQYYEKIEIHAGYFIVYLSKIIMSLFDNKIETNVCFNSELHDNKYIDILLNKSGDKLKTKIYDIITSSNDSELKKLGDKLKLIVLKYKVFIKLIKYINKIEINYKFNENNEYHTFYLELIFKNNISITRDLTHYNTKWEYINTDIITDALENNESDVKYLDYLLNAIINDSIFLYDGILDDLNSLDIDEYVKNIQDDSTIKTKLATFILTTCLFISKNPQIKNIRDKKEKENKKPSELEVLEEIENAVEEAKETTIEYTTMLKKLNNVAIKFEEEMKKEDYSENMLKMLNDLRNVYINLSKEVTFLFNIADKAIQNVSKMINDGKKILGETNDRLNEADNKVKEIRRMERDETNTINNVNIKIEKMWKEKAKNYEKYILRNT